MKLKGKIPIITRCWPQCPFEVTDRCNAPHHKCRLAHKSLDPMSMIIPDWCPLPDASKLIALLEREENNDTKSKV